MGFEEYKPIIVMVVCQFIYSGVTLTGRAALLQDMSSRVFVVYRQSIAFFIIAPIAIFSRRGTKGCFMGWKTFGLISLLSFVGYGSVTVNQNVYFEGLYLSSSSAASALANLVPAITFIMAYILGLEKVELRSMRSVAKIIGTICCVSGAAAMALLKGPKLLNTIEFHNNNQTTKDTWFLGCLFLLGSTFCWSIWLILQVHVTACYPDHLSLTAWMCLIAAIQSGILTLIVEPNTSSWKLTSPLQLFCCFYAGLGSAVTFFAQAWCIARRGPLFSAMFNPLCTVIVTVFACVFVHEELYTGSLLGGLAVIVGLYVVLWGKAKDHEDVISEDQSSQLASDNSTISCIIDLGVPLLPDKTSIN
ncbi:PREDICTED: WAT1-related protein At4g30420-like [Erythranthe guttata]|uniref:WAT1-related protein At4g30420-like n=1 Tax=Erythranthe guttata TaxID=4155 RepID=UPI00064DAF8D|nr:PREDICTED: WAT1-related protein At4g30420-like [Erythranthe guttata]|eukprot:XP_012841042.1 PREDICTED: WAT1-related protein At4g30420-like [Erythranthe guttata]